MAEPPICPRYACFEKLKGGINIRSAGTCRELQRRWFKEAAKAPAIPMPFHMSDCVAGSKSFRHLRDDEPTRLEMQKRMIETMSGLDMQVYGSAIIRADYEAVKVDLRAKPEYQDPWYLAFESAIQEMMFRSAEAGKNHRISLVFDRQDKGFRDRAFTLYNELLSLSVTHSDRFGGLTFEAKDKIAALQAIDVIVYETNRYIAEHMIGHLPQRWQSKLIGEYMPTEGMVYERQRLEELTRLVRLDRAGCQ